MEVDCGNDAGLTRWQFDRHSNKRSSRIVYTCCKPQLGPPPIPPYTFTPVQWYKVIINKTKYGDAVDCKCDVPLSNVKNVDTFNGLTGDKVVEESKTAQAQAQQQAQQPR
jgi:hypothetical protein